MYIKCIVLNYILYRYTEDKNILLKSLRSVQVSILEPKNYPRSSKN